MIVTSLSLGDKLLWDHCPVYVTASKFLCTWLWLDLHKGWEAWRRKNKDDCLEKARQTWHFFHRNLARAYPQREKLRLSVSHSAAVAIQSIPQTELFCSLPSYWGWRCWSSYLLLSFFLQLRFKRSFLCFKPTGLLMDKIEQYKDTCPPYFLLSLLTHVLSCIGS